MQNHYNNEKGSLYKFAEDHSLNSWEFDLIKRIVRCRKKGQFREDLEKSKFLIDLYLLEMDGPTPAPVTTYSYSVAQNLWGGFDFIVKDKGEEVYQDFGYITHLAATQEAQEWIKEQEPEEPKQEEPEYTYEIDSIDCGRYRYRIYKNNAFFYFDFEDTKELAHLAAQKWIKAQEPEQAAPVTTYSYSVIENTLGGFDFTIKDKGEEVYQHFGHYDTHLGAAKAAQEWIKAQEKAEQSAPVTTYSYSVIETPVGKFDFTIKDKGEEVYQEFGYNSRLKAQQEAQEWIKEQEAEPDPKYSYEEWLKSQRQA